MGRVAVRDAVAAYLTNAALPYVGTVYPARPVILTEDAYEQTLLGEAIALTIAGGSSAVLVVNIPSDERMRRADTGRGAVNDTRIHQVALEVWFASAGGDGVQAQQDYDGIVDAVVTLIRADATLGGLVWSAAEYTAGIHHEQAMPYTDADGAVVQIPGVIRFEVWEWQTGDT
ncbi:MAG: hypothetical protein ABSB73_13765 [Solirubrobacteraceae bacterium]